MPRTHRTNHTWLLILIISALALLWISKPLPPKQNARPSQPISTFTENPSSTVSPHHPVHSPLATSPSLLKAAALALTPDRPERRDWPHLTPAAQRYRPVHPSLDLLNSQNLVPGQILDWPLFDDVTLQTTITHVNTDANGTLQIRTTVKDSPHGYGIITRNGNQVYASFARPESRQEFAILQLNPESPHFALEVDPARTDQDLSCGAPVSSDSIEPVESIEPNGSGGSAGSPNRVDVLMVYTPAALAWANENGGINNIIAQAMQKGQLALDNSSVPIQLRLVHSAEINYVETDKNVDLERLTYPIGHPKDLNGDMDEVFVWRNQYGADLVALLESEPGTGGLGWILQNTSGDISKAFSLTRIQQAATGFTLVHELGHNMGCHHSRNQDAQKAPAGGGLYNYSTGWRWTGTDGESYASVMTYTEGDNRAPLFSNPDISYMGTPAGSYDTDDPTTGSFAPADNALSLRNIDFVISQYREEKTIVENPVTLLSPLGGEYWPMGSTQTIRWNSGFVLTVKIEFSANGGASWITLAENASGGLGRFHWTVPNTPTAEGKIRVSVSYATEFFDTTPGTFSIVPTPVGAWASTQLQPFPLFTWRDVQFVDQQTGWLTGGGYNLDASETQFQIAHTTDGGTNWIAQKTGNEYTPYDIFMLNDSRGWVSATKFTSSGTTTIILHTIDGGNNWNPVGLLDNHWINALHFVDENTGWAAGSLRITTSGNQILMKTVNGGANWSLVEEFSYNELYDLQMLNANQGWTAGSGGRIFHDSDGTGSWPQQTADTTSKILGLHFVDDQHGWMVGDGGLALKTTNGGTSWQVKNSGTLSELNDVQFVDTQRGWAVGEQGELLNTRDGGETWARQDSHTDSELYALSFIDELTGYAAGSDGVFLRYTGFTPELELTSPNGGQSWFATTTRSITWSSAYLGGDVRLQYSLNDGSSWLTIATRPVADGTYAWTVPQASSTQVRVRVFSVNNPSLTDQSDALFTIQPALDLLTPDGGDSLAAGSNFDITWQTIVNFSLRLEFSTNNGATWDIITDSTSPYSGRYRWSVPNLASTQCRVRISSTGTPSYPDSSENVFSIFQSQVVIVEPGSGDSWPAGSTQSIRWNSSNVDTFLIEYTANDGFQWESITNGVPASLGELQWSVPATPSSEARIRLIGQGGSAVTALSDPFFRIEPTQSNTTFLASRDTRGAAANLFVEGNLVYVADYASGVESFDVSDPANPAQVLDFKPPDNTWDIATRYPYAFLAIGSQNTNTGFSGLMIYDISDSATPLEISRVPTPDRAYGLVLDGDYAYVMAASSGLHIIDISDPVKPMDMSRFASSEIAHDARVVGSYLYMIEYAPFTETSIGPSYLRIIDISDPSTPEQTGFLEMPGSAQGLDVAGDFAYVAHWDTNYHAIRIININNPFNPNQVAEYVVPDLPYGVTVQDELLYYGYQGGGLRVLSLADPLAPEEVAWCTLQNEAAFLSSLTVQDDLVFVGNSVNGLFVIRNQYVPPPPPVPVPVILGPTTVTIVAGDPVTLPLEYSLYQLTLRPGSWKQAEFEAFALDGHLAAINTVEEQVALENLFMSGLSEQTPYWIGLNDESREGTFAWSNGDRVTYTKWKSGEPNNTGGNEDYVVANWEHARQLTSPKGTWNDSPLNGSSGYGGFSDGPYRGIMELPLSKGSRFSATNLPPGLGIGEITATITGLPTQTGVTTSTIRLTTPQGFTENSLRFNIIPYTFDIWMSRLTGTNLPPSKSRGPGDDPERDQLTNFGEYSANLNPMRTDSEQAYSVSLLESGGRQYLSLSYRLYRRASDVDIIIHRSSDLENDKWNEEGIVPVSISLLDPETDLVTVRSTTPISDINSEFFRFTVRRR